MFHEEGKCIGIGLLPLIVDKEHFYQPQGRYYVTPNWSLEGILSSQVLNGGWGIITCWESHEIVTLPKVATLIQKVARVKHLWIGKFFVIM